MALPSGPPMFRATLAVVSTFLIVACSAAPPGRAGGSTVDSSAVDRIVVHYAPAGDMQAPDVQRLEIRDPATIATWVAAIEAVPEQPAGGVRMIRFLANTPRHRVELYSGDSLSTSRRLMGGQLDVAAHPGWAFYSGEDRAFVALVAAVAPGA